MSVKKGGSGGEAYANVVVADEHVKHGLDGLAGALGKEDVFRVAREAVALYHRNRRQHNQ